MLTNMLSAIEQHGEYIRDVIVKADREGIKSLEAEEEAQKAWAERVSSYSETTIFGTCASWYLGSNIQGKKRASFWPTHLCWNETDHSVLLRLQQVLPWLGGFRTYIDIVNDVLVNNFTGMTVRK